MGDNYDDNYVDESMEDSGIETDLEKDEENEVDNDDADTDEGDSEKEDGKIVTPKRQSSKQDKAFAEYRKRAEAAEKQLNDINARTAKMFAEHGVKDIGQYLDSIEVQMLEQKKASLRESGYDDETIEEIVRKDSENAKLSEENAALKQQQYQERLVKAFESVRAEYPDVKTVDDIPDEAWLKFDKGYDLIDAYESVNKKQLREAEKAKVKQKTLNNINSKKHLRTEKDGAGDAVDSMIDEDTLQNYMDMGLSKKEALKKHKQFYG